MILHSKYTKILDSLDHVLIGCVNVGQSHTMIFNHDSHANVDITSANAMTSHAQCKHDVNVMMSYPHHVNAK